MQATSDYSLSTKTTSHNFTAIFVYVDDLILTDNYLAKINSIKHILDSQFNIKDLGILKYFFGFKVDRSPHGISLCQRKNSLDLLQDSGLIGAKPSTIALDLNINLQKYSGTTLDMKL